MKPRYSEGTICCRCGENPATIEFQFIIAHHGSPYCERCCIEKQVIYARESAEKLPELEIKLEKLGGPATQICCGMLYLSDKKIIFEGKEYDSYESCKKPEGHEGIGIDCGDNNRETNSTTRESIRDI